MLSNAGQKGINYAIHNSSNNNMCYVKKNADDEKSKEFEVGSDAEVIVG